MKIINFILPTAAAVAPSIADGGPGYSKCLVDSIIFIYYDYILEGGPIPDIGDRCNRLWGNINHAICSPSHTYCGSEQDNGILNWQLRTDDFCDMDYVSGAWNNVMWDLTPNVTCYWD
ncbi:hypothetical protein PG987_003810 [Apiospora arundinis]